MTAKNDITGDTIATKTASDAYRDNYDAIFRKKSQLQADMDGDVSPEFAKVIEGMIQVNIQEEIDRGAA